MGKQQFVNSQEFISGVVSSTKAGFGGSSYSAEFFNDGSHRVMWTQSIGNRYEHPNSEIVTIPQLSQEQCNEADDGEMSLEDVAEFYRDELAEEFLS